MDEDVGINAYHHQNSAKYRGDCVCKVLHMQFVIVCDNLVAIYKTFNGC